MIALVAQQQVETLMEMILMMMRMPLDMEDQEDWGISTTLRMGGS